MGVRRGGVQTGEVGGGEGGVNPGKYVGGEGEGISLEWGEKGRCTDFQAKGNMGGGEGRGH